MMISIPFSVEHLAQLQLRAEQAGLVPKNSCVAESKDPGRA
jgi:hypothetical protein